MTFLNGQYTCKNREMPWHIHFLFQNPLQVQNYMIIHFMKFQLTLFCLCSQCQAIYPDEADVCWQGWDWEDHTAQWAEERWTGELTSTESWSKYPHLLQILFAEMIVKYFFTDNNCSSNSYCVSMHLQDQFHATQFMVHIRVEFRSILLLGAFLYFE